MVEVLLTDASGKDWRFIDKFFMFDDAAVLGPGVIFPAEIGIPCTIIDTYERDGRHVARISTARWCLESVDGTAEFEIEASKLRPGT